MTKTTNLMDIPSAVKDEVQYLLETEGGDIVRLGDYQGFEAYQYCFPDGMVTGFPVVILYHRASNTAYEQPGEEGLGILAEMFNK